MFQIPDDDEDDEFWKEFPLEEFENIPEPTNKGEKRQGSPLEKPQEELKKPCMRNIENDIAKNLIPDSRLCPNILPSVSNNNNNGPLQDVSLSSNKLLSVGKPQKAGGDPQNLTSPAEHDKKHETSTRGSVSENYSIRQQQQQKSPPNDRGLKRKFPGPAGLLPRLVPGQKLNDSVMKLDGRADAQLQKNDALLSPNSVEDLFGEGPWLKLIGDLGEDSSRILKTFSIKELQLKACKKQLPHGKVLLLFTVLETVDLSSIDASVRLCDRTGSIQGTIHRNLIKEYGEHLQPGTVLVLKQVGVLSPTLRTHYLNITANNLVSLYSTLPSGQVGFHWQEEGMTYRQLVTNAEMLQKSQMFSSPSRPAPHLRTSAQQSPRFQSPALPVVNRHHSSIQMNRSQNVTAKNSPLNYQAKVCDNISGFPSQRPHVPIGTPNSNSTIRCQHPSNIQNSSPFSNKEIRGTNPGVSPAGRSRWTFKSKTSNTDALNNSLNSQSPAPPVSAGCSNNGVNMTVSTGDKYRLRAENCVNTTTETTSNVSDIWQDDLSDDILSQLSDDLF